MKTISVIAVIFALVFSVTAFTNSDWQEVALDGAGTLKIPQNWTAKDEDGYICIYNENGLSLVEYGYCFSGKSGVSEKLGIKTIQLVPDYEKSKGFVRSNNVFYSLARYLIDGEEKEKFGIDFEDKSFIVWDDSLTEEFLIKIGDTFERFEK